MNDALILALARCWGLCSEETQTDTQAGVILAEALQHGEESFPPLLDSAAVERLYHGCVG
jgi:hypothetical protein